MTSSKDSLGFLSFHDSEMVISQHRGLRKHLQADQSWARSPYSSGSRPSNVQIYQEEAFRQFALSIQGC